MKLFLRIVAVLAWIFGAALLFVPDRFYAPAGIVLTPMQATVAQEQGGTLVGLGVIDWIGASAEGVGLVAILAGNLVVQILSLGVVLRTMSLGAGAQAGAGLAIHVILGALFVICLVRARRRTSQARPAAASARDAG